MLEYCYSRNFLLGIVFINCNLELLIKTFNMEKWHKIFSNRTTKCNKKRTYTIIIRSHQNDTCNLSPAIIQPHVERRPLTGLQFDVQRKIKLILGESYFRASVTFTTQNYVSKSNFRKLCCLCYDNEIGPGQKMQKQTINKLRNQCQTCGSSTCLRHCLQICVSCFDRCRDMFHD